MLHEPKAVLAGSLLESPWTWGGLVVALIVARILGRAYNSVFGILPRRD